MTRLFTFLCALLFAGSAIAEKTAYLDLARRGWNYELRTTMIGRDLSIPVHINGRDLAGAAICIVGDAPHAETRKTLEAFAQLLEHSFGKPVPTRFAGEDARSCGSGRTVILRLYSGFPPNRALSADLEWMNDAYGLGLPAGREYMATSPAMAQTFFGRYGQTTHIMVMQPRRPTLSPLETAFHKSILIEELFQSFTFGMDILIFDRSRGFLSKLQETPINLQRLPWESHAFMRALLKSNPGGLCPFDLFMLHAVARAPVDETVQPAFIDYIDQHFDDLHAAATRTMQDARFEGLLDTSCAAPV